MIFVTWLTKQYYTIRPKLKKLGGQDYSLSWGGVVAWSMQGVPPS